MHCVVQIDIIHIRQFLIELAILQLVLIVPQPIYYIIVEIMKVSGEYADLYYPSSGALVGQIFFILSLYVTPVILYILVRAQVNDAVSQIHPFYDFATNKLFTKRPYRSSDGYNLRVSPHNEKAPLVHMGGATSDDEITEASSGPSLGKGLNKSEIGTTESESMLSRP